MCCRHSPLSALHPSHPIRAPRRSSILSAIPPPSIRASCIWHKDNGSTGPDGDDPQRDVVRAKSARAHGDEMQPPFEQQLRCEQESRPHCAPSPSARHLRLPWGNADARQAHARKRGKGYLLRECWGGGSEASCISFTVFHLPQLYVLCIILLQ
jgi:hypothetical protein